MCRDFSFLEVEKAIRSMGSFKAPGIDGYQPVFYHKYWEVVGTPVHKFSHSILRNRIATEWT